MQLFLIAKTFDNLKVYIVLLTKFYFIMKNLKQKHF